MRRLGNNSRRTTIRTITTSHRARDNNTTRTLVVNRRSRHPTLRMHIHSRMLLGHLLKYR